MLNILENYDLKKQGRWSKETLHLMIESMRRAFCDRARWLGDPDFTTIPVAPDLQGIRRQAGQGNRPDQGRQRAQALAKDITAGMAKAKSTTHFSVIDKDGMAVANTYTLEGGYGWRVVVKGAGFLLNNEMNDFNWYPGVTDKKGTSAPSPIRSRRASGCSVR